MAVTSDSIAAQPAPGAPRAEVDWAAAFAWTFLGGLALLVAATFRDYGISWDEMLQNTYGDKLIAFYTSGFRDRSAFSYVNLYLYGGLFDMAAALANTVSPFGEYETRHLLGGLVFVAGLLGGWRLATLVGGRRAGVIALLCLATTPLLYGHSFINPKDSPFAWLSLWTIYYGCRILETPERPARGALVGFGISLGLAMGTRVMALILPVYIGAILLAYVVTREPGRPQPGKILKQTLRLGLPLLAVLPISIVLMAVFWPWSVTAPLNVFGALETFSHFTWQPTVLWDGEMVPSAHLPPVYLTSLLVLQLPEYVLAGLALAAAFAVAALGRASLREARTRQVVLLALAAVVPLVAFAVIRPVVYNGVRHFLFVVPPLVVLAAIGLDRLLEIIPQKPAKFAAAAVLVVALLRQTAALADLHPYEYVFYNAFEGGIQGAEKQFELDYWGTSLGEAARGLTAYMAKSDALPKPGAAAPKVYVCGDRMSAAYFLPKEVFVTDKRTEADYYIGINDPPCRDHFENPRSPVFAVQRDGVTLGYALDLRAGRAAD